MATITFIGTLTKDAESSYTPEGVLQAKFTTAEDLGYGDKKHAWFIGWRWNNPPEKMLDYLKKGRKFMFSGAINACKVYQPEGKEPMVSTFGEIHSVQFLPFGKKDEE